MEVLLLHVRAKHIRAEMLNPNRQYKMSRIYGSSVPSKIVKLPQILTSCLPQGGYRLPRNAVILGDFFAYVVLQSW